MTRNTKKATVVVLFALAGVLLVVALVNWQAADDTAAQHREAQAIGAAAGYASHDVSTDHTASYVLFAVAGLSVISAVVLLGSLPEAEELERSDIETGWG